MLKLHYDRYFAGEWTLQATDEQGDHIVSGKLVHKENGREVPITNKIPRFVAPDQNYAKGFGLQWNRFKSTQLDSHSGLSLTTDRFWQNTKWTPEELKGKRVLEAGSGAGRFTEVILSAGAELVTFDLSNAVEANLDNNAHKGDVFIFQGSIYDIPFPPGYFDYVFCYGVLQHTPDPQKSFDSLLSMVKPGGKLSVDNYFRVPRQKYWPDMKYGYRKITTRLKPATLLRIIKFYMPWWLPVNTFLLTKGGWLGRKMLYFLNIPVWNYHHLDITNKQKLEWAILDTFDGMGATYDFPKNMEEFEAMVASKDHAFIETFRGSNGLVANITKGSGDLNPVQKETAKAGSGTTTA